jgi:translation initiation factor 4G
MRRDSSQPGQGDMGIQGHAQGPGGPGRGGFPSQGGRGRGGFNPQYQQQMGYPPTAPPFRNQPNQGRGGMAPPFQGQGRPMNPQFPNSPHQAARSPALANALPGTPNMNPAMPMQNPQQFSNYYPPHMQGPQVYHPSFSQHSSDMPKSNKNRRTKSWRKNEQYSQSQRSSEQSRELYSHYYTSRGPMPAEREIYRHSEARPIPLPTEPTEHGHSPQPQQSVPMPPGSFEGGPTTADDPDYPPLPPPFPLPPISPPVVGFPQMGVAHVMEMDISPEGGGFDQFLTMRQQQNYGFPPQGYPDRMGMPMQTAPFMYPQMQYMNGAPPAQQPGYQQPNAYIPGQYAPQAQPMSRNSSQVSDQRPASSMGQPGTPSMTPAVSHSLTPQSKAAPETSAFMRPTRKSAAIVIKKPDGEALNVENLKAPASPAPQNRARTPPVIASTPTPPPKSSTPQHARTDSAAFKSQEQVRLEIMEKVKKAAESGTDSPGKADEAAKEAAEAKLKDEEKAKEEAKAKADDEAEAAAAKAKKEEEDEEIERQIREMEEAEAEREKKEAEILAKRTAEKAAAEKAAAEKYKLDAAENDRKLREQEKEMERLEDERERKRAEAEAEAHGTDKAQSDTESKDAAAESKPATDDKNAPVTPTTIASKLSNLTLGSESGASTPASDDSMPPPPPKASSTESKRVKPAALNLAPLNTKPVEPPQPSAALQSLKSARFLTVLNSSIYPPNINSPNPALNSAVAAKGKSFKYDKEFLLQFQKVFTEKPSLEFAEQVKNLIGEGDGGSARSASTRQSSSMGPRQGSNRNPPGAFAMGSFGAVGAGGKTLPPGTTSAERFAMSTGTMSRPPINPMASFNRPGGAFPGGSQMTRTPSSSAMNAMPHSPRQQSRQRGGSKRDGYQSSNAKQEAQAAKTMPLTAGMELKPIQVSATGWKPRSIGANQAATGAAGPAPGAALAGHMEPDMVQRKVKAALNKMTPEKFDKIADQILAIAAQSKDEADGRTLRQVIQLTFEKATDEAHWASMYAKFCKRMLETMSPDIKDESILDKNGNVVSGGNLFRKYLLNRCQEEFERGWKIDLPEKPEGERGEEKTEEAVMLSDEYYIAAAAKRRGLGLVQFIGELYKLSMLTERIMHECVKKLVDYTGIPDEAEIESLTKLLKTIGANLDSTEKGKPMMDVYFTRIQAMIDTPDLPSRLKFMLMDIVDLRRKNWQSKESNKGPKTLEEVRAEVRNRLSCSQKYANPLQAEAAAAQKAAESSRGSQRGGGGGRMQIGRGDSRNFSNQYGAQPPVDYTKNTVGMDDLRRLTNKGGANRQSSSQMSFGPTSLFSSRSNSRKAGPSGSQSRTGEDSGASSRTGTPPQQKEKVSSSVNAFRYITQPNILV